MFGLFASQDTKMRENAANWLELADKVYHFRRDVLTAAQLGELQTGVAELQALVKEKAGAEKVKLAIERLEEVLQRTGGAIYPKTALVENIEFFLVAAIVILGIRTYFVQPFKIPTNSMWPTYNGMTPQVYKAKADEPGPAAVAARTVLFGAWPHRLDAPADGEILIPVFGEARSLVHCRTVPGKSWLILPTDLREYSIVVGDAIVRTKLPMDFDFDWAVYDAFFAENDKDAFNRDKFFERIQAKGRAGQVVTRVIDGQDVNCVRTGKFVKAGERVMSFDELTGDQLFVDRFSYHFMQPAVGQGFVFRTDHIKSRFMVDGRTGGQLEQYYIKRLVGTPGDKLEVREPVLYRNGQPIAGSTAFAANANREGQYGGYFNSPIPGDGFLMPGQVMEVPRQKYFAMGDNSANSQDGRYWGYVPAKDVVGRPLFVYFPFTRHWGPAR